MGQAADIYSREEALAMRPEDRPICYRIPNEIWVKAWETIGHASTGIPETEASRLVLDLCFLIAEQFEKYGVILLHASPIPLTEGQEALVKKWAADDRLWTTQETVEFNLRTFARSILKTAATATQPHNPMERRFHILNTWAYPGQIDAIPWGLIAPHEAQAMNNHGGQTLERLEQRGGLSPCEAVAVLEDADYRKRWPDLIRSSEDQMKHFDAAIKRLRELVEIYNAASPRPVLDPVDTTMSKAHT